ncbi:hypothetical protein GALMADRAFT_233027 [Galerina marginata CBS 339.88]|uniref:PHD-type domain-containing protein n=1 Tax=Galerina marginata (strain CBS 339.88) TaxID=685588 RepID=A0A067TQX4_GALM3|nr:hypothetical protein GALMADRAFT_233027 [Galerina marginata CBS 339.88]
MSQADDSLPSSVNPLCNRSTPYQTEAKFQQRAEPPQDLLPAFTTKQYSHLPTPQSPKNIGRYVHDRSQSPESPVPYGLPSGSSTLSNRRVGNMNLDLEGNATPSHSALQQCATPESSPQFPQNFPLDYSHTNSATPRHFVSSSAADFSTPKQISSKSKPTNSLSNSDAVLSRISTPPMLAEHPIHSAALSSPFMAKLSIGDSTIKTVAPTHIDDVFSSSQPIQAAAISASISTPPISPLPQSVDSTMVGAGGEMERIRQSMMEDRLTQIREAEKRRPEYLKRAKRTLSEADPTYLEEEERDRALAVGIMESPHKGRRLKLFQETSEESFEESLMAGGYGRYRTADWVRQPQPISLPPSAIAGSSTIISLLEEAEEVPPSEKELRKRKRLAAFRAEPMQNNSKLCAVELEGKGRVLIDVPAEERTIPGSPEPAPSKKKVPNRRKKKVNEVVLNKRASGVSGSADDQVEKPNWPDTEFPWRLRTEERLELVKAEEEERLHWIERFLDRDSDDEDEIDSGRHLNGPAARETSPTPHLNYDRPSSIPVPGRGKMVPLMAYPGIVRYDGVVKSSAFPSDPADARAALLSKRSVRAFSYRQQKRQREMDDEDDDETVCICNGKDDGRELVQCDACQTWYHLQCIGIRNIAELGREEDAWFCRRCVSRSRSPSTEPEITLTSEPTFVPTDERSVSRSSDTPFFQPGLQDSPNWASRTPKTPTRDYHGFPDSRGSWVESSRAGPSTPQHQAPAVRIYSSPFESYHRNYEDESPFDPTSTPSRGIKFHPPFATPKSNPWVTRGGLFQTPSRPAARGPTGKASSSNPIADDGAPHNIPAQDTFGRAHLYDESPIRRAGDGSMARRTIHSPPRSRVSGSNFSFLEESPVMRTVGSQLPKEPTQLRNTVDRCM